MHHALPRAYRLLLGQLGEDWSQVRLQAAKHRTPLGLQHPAVNTAQLEIFYTVISEGFLLLVFNLNVY